MHMNKNCISFTFGKNKTKPKSACANCISQFLCCKNVVTVEKEKTPFQNGLNEELSELCQSIQHSRLGGMRPWAHGALPLSLESREDGANITKSGGSPGVEVTILNFHPGESEGLNRCRVTIMPLEKTPMLLSGYTLNQTGIQGAMQICNVAGKSKYLMLT